MRSALALGLLAACSAGPTRKLQPDLRGVAARFAPTQKAIGEALGISTGAIPLGSDPATVAARASYFDRMTAAGLAIVRRDFLWSRIEPQPGVFDFTADDAAVADATAHGVSTIGILAYNATWATPTGDEHAPPDPVRYAEFVQATAAHFRGRVLAWEIWNEPNIGFRFWKPVEDPAAYARVLARAYPAAKAGDPSTPVLFGGVSWHAINEDALTFVADAYFERPDLGRFYDVMSLHPYPVYPPQAPPEAESTYEPSLERKLAMMRAELVYYGDGEKPIWVTEMGWPTYGTVDEAAQARDTVHATVEALASGAERVLLYTLDDGAANPFAPAESFFGLERAGPAPKAAYGAVRALVTLDRSAIALADESVPPVRVFRFAGFRIAFSIDGAIHPFALAGRTALDAQGRALATPPSALQVGPDPVYALP